MKRLHVPLAKEGRLEVDGERAHYLATVLRVREGECIEAFDGLGSSFDARVVEALPGRVSLDLGEKRQTSPLRSVTVVQGLPKADKLELIIQKGTELGASGFIAVATHRSVKKVADKEAHKLARWRRIAEEAARQSGRSDVPSIAFAASLKDVSLPGVAVLVLDETERLRTLSAAVSAIDSHHPLAMVIGPEGGLEHTEVEALTARAAQTVTLGSLVLRTETAALAALAVIRHLDGHLG